MSAKLDVDHLCLMHRLHLPSHDHSVSLRRNRPPLHSVVATSEMLVLEKFSGFSSSLPLATVAFCVRSPLLALVLLCLQFRSCWPGCRVHLCHRNRIDSPIHDASKTTVTSVRLASFRPATTYHFVVMASSLNWHSCCWCCCRWRCCDCHAICRTTNDALPYSASIANYCSAS